MKHFLFQKKNSVQYYNKPLAKQQLVITHRYTILCEAEKTDRSLIDQHLSMSYVYSMQGKAILCIYHILTWFTCAAQMSSNAGISVRRIVG
jgi:hypothetical protein